MNYSANTGAHPRPMQCPVIVSERKMARDLDPGFGHVLTRVPSISQTKVRHVFVTKYQTVLKRKSSPDVRI